MGKKDALQHIDRAIHCVNKRTIGTLNPVFVVELFKEVKKYLYMPRRKNNCCPLCSGSGYLKVRKKWDDSEMRKQCVTILYKKGFKLREIQRLLGYKSPRSVSVALGRV